MGVSRNNFIIKPAEPILAMFCSVIICLVLLAFPDLVGGWLHQHWVPAANAEVVMNYWWAVFGWLLCSLVEECLKLQDRRYTLRVWGSTIIGNMLQCFFASSLLLDMMVMNPTFVDEIGQIVQTKSPVILQLLANLNVVALSLIVMALMVDTIVTTWFTFARREE